MSFAEVQLPTKFSAGSFFGPGFRTKITELENMHERRFSHAPVGGRRRYDLSRGIANLDDLYEIYEFFIARDGAFTGFRLKDWVDYASTSTGSTHRPGDSALAFGDQVIGVGNGTETRFQLVKRYTSGSTVKSRTIFKPVSGTVVVGINGVSQASGWAVDTTTGIITFDSAPGNGLNVTAGFEFDTPVRFAESTDEALQISIQAMDTGELPAIECIEEINPATVSQTFEAGGAQDLGDMSSGSTFSITQIGGMAVRCAPAVAGKVIQLPSEDTVPTGGPIFVIKNNGSASVQIQTSAGGVVLSALAAGDSSILFLTQDSVGAKSWIATV